MLLTSVELNFKFYKIKSNQIIFTVLKLKMKIAGIYKIQSIAKPDRIYIGSAMDIHKRWEQHLLRLKRNKHHSQKLQRHYNKYGKNDLIFSILIGCEKTELINTEQYFIDVYQPYFNGRLKAYSNEGFKHTEEAKRKIGESKKGVKNHNYGKHLSAETRKKMSNSKKGISVNLGRKHTEEAKKKISLSRIGKPNPHKGNIPSAEGIKRIKELLKGRIPWNKGLKQSEETKKKVSESMRLYHIKKRMELSIN